MEHRMVRLVFNELMILVRDSSVLFWILMLPFFFLFMMLFAFGSEGNLPQQTIEIVDLDDTAASRRYVEEVRRSFSGNESIPGHLVTARAHDLVAQGASRVTIPEGFGWGIERGRTMPVAVSFAQDGLPAQLVVRVVRALSLRFEAQYSGAPALVEVRTDARGAAPGLAFAHYALTGTMVMAMMSAGMTSICQALAYRRERNGFKMLACMPMSARTFMAAMLLSRLLVLVGAAFVLVLGAQYLFGVPLVLSAGRLLQGGALMVIGGTMLLALGTALGARLATVSGAAFVTGLAYIALLFLSDLTMPMSAMPPGVSAVMAHLPPALFVDALRHVFIHGEGLSTQWRPIVEMAGWTALFAVVAQMTFRWHRQ